MKLIFILLIVFQIKHFVADYLLQTPYMLGKFKDTGWMKPLAAHCGVQALFTFVISLTALFSTPRGLSIALCLSVLDFMIHFIMDRIKASPKMLGRFESLSKEQFRELVKSRQIHESKLFRFEGYPSFNEERRKRISEIDEKFKGNKYFWWALGFDQMVHHLTDILIVFLIVGAML